MADVGALPSKREDNCNAIKFADFCKLLERLGRIQGSANKLKLIFSKDLKAQLQGQSVFPLLRLLLPLNDTERGKYGLKQAMIAKTYVGALHLDKNSDDAKRLINWKDPTKNQGIDVSKLISGDFGLILEDVLKTRVRAESCTLTLGEVNAVLDELASSVTTDEKATILRTRILNAFNSLEQKWLVRIIFQDLKIGLKHENVLAVFYPTALRRYNECTNLRMVCEEESTAAALTGVQLYIHFAPMLAKGFPNAAQGQVPAVEQALVGCPFVMDHKLDGERALLHIGEDNSFVIYTRKGNDYTENYWPVVHDVIASIRARFPGGGDSGARTKRPGPFSVILDGEICALDGRTKGLLPFGKNLSVARAEREYGTTSDRASRVGWHVDLPAWMCFVCFDIVHIDGPGCEQLLADIAKESRLDTVLLASWLTPGELTHLPLAFRRTLLARLVQPNAHRVEIVQHKEVRTNDVATRRAALADYFEEVVRAGGEGLVVKSLVSKYMLGERNKAGAWVKMKPEYGDYLDDLDVLILGAYYGEGQSMRGEGLSTFLCAVHDPTGLVPYVPLLKVGTGYSFSELTELRARIGSHAVPWDIRQHVPGWQISKRDDRPDVYIPPEHSVVLQVKCAELVPSVAFPGGLTCRFPRVSRIRYDKDFRQVTKLAEVQAMVLDPSQGVQNRVRTFKTREDDNDDEEHGGGRGRKKAVTAKVSQAPRVAFRREDRVDPQFTLQGRGKVPMEGKLFAGRCYCVLECDYTHVSNGVATATTRASLMEQLLRQGAELVASASHPRCLVIAGGSKRTIQLQNLILQGERDIIDYRYILRCLELGRLLPEQGFDYLGMSAITQQRFRIDHCPLNDSYTEEVDEEALSRILDGVEDALMSRDERAQAAREEYRRLKTLTWQQILSIELCLEERPLEGITTCLFQASVVIFVDMYTDLGPMTPTASGYEPCCRPLGEGCLTGLRVLKTRLRSRGAVLAENLHGQVSHVVMVPDDLHDRKIVVKERLRLLRLVEERGCEKWVVRPVWAEACLVAQTLLEPEASMLVPLS